DYYILGGDELYTDVKHTKPLDREIIDVTLIGVSADLFTETKRSQQDKPYYVPDKKHLLEYDDPFYCEDTPEKLKLRAFLKERCNLSDERESIVFEALLYGARSITVQTTDVFEHLEKMRVRLKSQRDVEQFAALYSAFHNSTRMPCNRGHTPDEMMQMTPPEKRFKSLSLGPNIRKSLQTGEMDIDDFRKQILTMELSSEAMRFDLLKQLADIKASTPQPEKQKKVGRNDPCPCGSGKKYKRCCGK
ncbi:MAG: SEC-C metal-binding domain-containing protein, partial [Oscillospiraceae bacterium]|nr:SEC-C metal-binding domain-containing protein [Oscillospiraceae bacterium]